MSEQKANQMREFLDNDGMDAVVFKADAWGMEVELSFYEGRANLAYATQNDTDSLKRGLQRAAIIMRMLDAFASEAYAALDEIKAREEGRSVTQSG